MEASPTAVLSPMQRQLRWWWDRLHPQVRDGVLVATLDPADPLPEWIAQNLLRAGIPLTLRAGFDSDAPTGIWKVPPEVREFLATKRVATGKPQRRMFRRSARR
jgi:hypothetical protein